MGASTGRGGLLSLFSDDRFYQQALQLLGAIQTDLQAIQQQQASAFAMQGGLLPSATGGQSTNQQPSLAASILLGPVLWTPGQASSSPQALFTTNGPVLVAQGTGLGTTAATGVIGSAHFPVPAHGTIYVSSVITSTAAYTTYTRDGTNFYGFNSAVNQTLSAVYEFTLTVAKNDVFDISTSANTTLAELRALFVPSL